ncbi:MAG: gfo/Idh/MocA family oxidoreductase, partial [Alphaproteobacteria bacterium]
MTEPLTVACVGAGYFSRFHYDAWARIAGARPVASVDRDIARARATGLAAYGDLDAMLAELRPDIIDIITPPVTHLGYIRKALATGPRAVICQKPFCRNLEEAREAARLAEAAGIPLIVHENFRFQPWYRAIRAEIEAGAIGEVLQLTFRLRPGDGQGPDAYLDRQPYFRQMPRFLVHETAVHWIDTFRYLMGPPEAVFADLRKMNPVIAGEDAGYILFRYPGGRRAMFDGNRLLDHAADNTRCTMGEALAEGNGGTMELRGDGSVHLRAFGAL